MTTYLDSINQVVEIERLRALGVDGLFTDYPERASILDRVA